MVYGSEGDWISQHVAVAESLRDAMLRQHTLIPQYINLGGGSSVYDFSYYGLLRPDVLFSCLVPGIPMGYIISGYSILCIVASTAFMYLWLRRKELQKKFSAAGAFLLICSGSFFHFHHQIMFVNYMPYLLLALMGVDRLWQKRRSGLLILSLALICLHSYYYAIACLCVVGIYGIYLVLEHYAGKNHLKETGTLWKDLLSMTGLLARSFAISIAMTMILLLPTGLGILATSKDGGNFAREAVKIVDPSFRGLLYSSYSCGMTLLVLYALLLSLLVKGKRFLSLTLLICMTVPAVNLALNGFLYAREKILIPFVPLLVLVAAETLQRIWTGKQKARLWPALLCFVPMLFDGWKISRWKEIVLLDGVILLLWTLLHGIGTHYHWEQTKKGRILQGVTLLLAVAPIVTSVIQNKSETYIASDDQRQSRFTREEIAAVVTDSNYRFDVIADRLENCNLLYGNTKRSSMYSSITNDVYSTFYYDTIGNAIPANNRVALLPGINPCSNYFLGVRYLLCKEDQVPSGYTARLVKNGYVLAENPSVLPICYGSTDTPVTGDSWKEKAEPEDQLEVELLAEHLKTLCAGMKPELPVAVARLQVDSSGKNPVIITLNGIRNKLSADNAPYPNNNRIFTYVMAVEGTPGDWSMDRSEGDYLLSDIQWTAIEPGEWGSRSVILPESGSEAAHANVYNGSIQMPCEGWFVTSYPWRMGYEIQVDGENVQPQKINKAFLGFPLDGGEHEITIEYTAPGYYPGLAGTIMGFGAFLALLLWEMRNKKGVL